MFDPSGLVTADKAARDPDETKVAAPVQPFPGRRIICDVAPAFRIAVTDCWTVVAHVVMLGTGLLRVKLQFEGISGGFYHREVRS